MYGDALTLEGLDNGAALELFQAGLQRALENIQDPNTVADAVRRVTLTVEIKPTKNRLGGALKYYVKETLVGAEPRETSVLMGMENGVAVASEYGSKDPRQTTLEQHIAAVQEEGKPTIGVVK